jgi:hypothetical protein
METAIVAPISEFAMSFPAAIPTQITLETPANGTVDLAGDSEQLDLGAASGPFTLAFVPEIGADVGADYFDVTLHRLDGSALVTERVYTVTEPTVRIDGAHLPPGAEYVLQIRSFRGHPNARQGDFRPVDYPYGSAIVFTRTFHTS